MRTLWGNRKVSMRVHSQDWDEEKEVSAASGLGVIRWLKRAENPIEEEAIRAMALLLKQFQCWRGSLSMKPTVHRHPRELQGAYTRPKVQSLAGRQVTLGERAIPLAFCHVGARLAATEEASGTFGWWGSAGSSPRDSYRCRKTQELQ